MFQTLTGVSFFRSFFSRFSNLFRAAPSLATHRRRKILAAVRFARLAVGLRVVFWTAAVVFGATNAASSLAATSALTAENATFYETASSIVDEENDEEIAVESRPRLQISVDPEQIYLGESTVFTTRVDGVETVDPPDVSALEENFELESLGATRFSDVKTVYENGVRRVLKEQGILFRYRLTPRRTGFLTFGAPNVTDNEGNVLTAEPTTLTVLPPTGAGLVLLETSLVAPKRVFPLTPFEIGVDVFVKELPGDYSDQEPISLISKAINPPHLLIPWLDSPQIADATVSSVSLEDWLENQIADEGFALNVYSFADSSFVSGLSLFSGSRRPTTFLPTPQKVERPDANGTPTTYWKYSFKRRLRASKIGKLTFEAAMLKGDFLEFDNGNPKRQEVYAVSKTLEIDVAPIPEESAPDDYVGVVGKIVPSAQISSETATVGDALTLVVSLRGTGLFDAAQAPNIQSVTAVAEAFKTYPPRERTLDDGIAFEYPLRPLSPGRLTIPPLSVSYFDVEKGDFATLATEPLEIDVRPGAATPRQPDDENASDESARQADDGATSGALRSTLKVGSATLAVLVAIAAIVYGVVICVRFNARRVATGNARIVESARETLETGLRLAASDPSATVATTRLAFLQLVARRLGRPADSLTDAEALDFLKREFGSPDDPDDAETLLRLRAFFRRAERTRFAGSARLDAGFAPATRELFERWVEFLSARVRKLATWAAPLDVESDEYDEDNESDDAT